jgi:hypothetical protein
MSQHLFVGGLADGRWIETNERERVRAAAAPKINPRNAVTGELPEGMDSFREQMYQAHRFQGSMPDTHWLVYAPLDWSPDHVFTKLLGEYNP